MPERYAPQLTKYFSLALQEATLIVMEAGIRTQVHVIYQVKFINFSLEVAQ
jgi:hypothetical protein